MGRIDNTKGRVLVYCRGRRFAGPAGDVSGADAIRRFAEAYNEVGDERVGYAALCREILGVAPGAPLRRRSRFEAYEDRDTLWLKLLLDGGEDDAAVRAFLEPLVRVCEEFTFCPETEEFRGVYTIFRGVRREDGSVEWGRFRFDLRERGMFNGGFEDYERSVLGGGNAPAGEARRRLRERFAEAYPNGSAIEYRRNVMTGAVNVDWSGGDRELSGAAGSAGHATDDGNVMYDSVDAETILRIMRRLGYCVELNGDGDIRWVQDGIVALVLFGENGKPNPNFYYRCSYDISSDDLPNAIALSNAYNCSVRFGCSSVEYNEGGGGWLIYRLALDLKGGVPRSRIVAFFSECTNLMKDWKSRVVDNL